MEAGEEQMRPGEETKVRMQIWKKVRGEAQMTNRQEGGRKKPTNEEQTSHAQVKHITKRGRRGSKTLKTSGEEKTFKIKQEVCKKHAIKRENQQEIIKVRPRAAEFICNNQKLEKYLNGLQK